MTPPVEKRPVEKHPVEKRPTEKCPAARGAVDTIAFRHALGAFATGVTIVTTRDANGRPLGVTASSFNSVSLDPPLVLWSLARNSLSCPAFEASGHFAIHVLAGHQEALSNRFACAGEDKFRDIGWTPGVLGSPVLDDYAALFECRTEYRYAGGDHVILVGEVVNFVRRDSPPLLFHAGAYAERRGRPRGALPSPVDLDSGRFTDDFLFYLLARAYFQTSQITRAAMAECGLQQSEYLVLAALSMESPSPAPTLIAQLQHTGHAPDALTIAAMADRQLLTRTEAGFELAAAGRTALIRILAATHAVESDLAAAFTPGEWADAKRALRRIIELTDCGIPLRGPAGAALLE